MGCILRCRSCFPSALVCALAGILAPAAPAAAQDAVASAEAQALVLRGEARRLQGRAGDALADLSRAHALAPSQAERAFASAALGVALREAGQPTLAQARLAEALAAHEAGAAPDPAFGALVRATLAALSVEAAPVELSVTRAAREANALAAMAAARAQAAGGPPAVVATVAAEAARLAARLGSRQAALDAAAEGLAAAARIPADPAGRHAALALAAAAAAVAPFDAAAARLAAQGYALAAAPGPDGPDRIAALGAAGQGETDLRQGRPAAARGHASTAQRTASALGLEDAGFRAQWLAARAAEAEGDRAAALAAYRSAFDGLRRFRLRAPMGAPPATAGLGVGGGVPGGTGRFQLDFIAFLLAGAGDGTRPGDQPVLVEAVRLIEDVKLDEVDEYFDERCAPAREATADASALAVDVAVLYPVTFEDRLEMILAAGGRLHRHSAPIGRAALAEMIGLMRLRIDSAGASAMPQARALHAMLVAPFAPALAGVSTLVVAPDGPLRALPFAALHDGRAWLGERYGLATILGLDLVRRQSFAPDEARVLAAGAQTPSPDYPSLPAVPQELAAIGALFPGELLLDEAFSVGRVADAIARRSYAVVHIATHAEFGAKPADNFLIAQDGRLDMDRLEAILRLRAVRDNRPLDLLTLSACNTAAAGGAAAERAPLGLASVGFRAGARSVLASLWPAEDRATAQLMGLFYAALREGAPRAEALRRAQAALIAQPDMADPYQWANFILIGDWR